MIRIILFLILTISIANCFDPLQIDKEAHLGAGYIITDIEESKLHWDATQSFFGTLAWGFGTEIEQQVTSSGVYDVEDVYATMLGWALKRLVFEVKF